MAVLKSVSEKWRLFWVLEAIGLSFLLAVLAIKVTGNATSVERNDGYHHDYFCHDQVGCGVYQWRFIFYTHPVAVTVCAVLATSLLSNPRGSSVVKKICLTVCAALIFCSWYIVHLLLYSYFVLAGYVGGVCALGVLVCFCKELKEQITRGNQRFREAVDQRPRKYLLLGGVIVFVCRTVLFFVPFVVTIDIDVLQSSLDFVLGLWILRGVFAAVHPAGGVARIRFRWMLLGWGLNNLFSGLSSLFSFVRLSYFLCILAVGTCLWGEEPGTYGVAFWFAATELFAVVINCMDTWFWVWGEGIVK